ncbi:MAG: hypothetical protein GEU71_03720 [Actinobacteria bacterium]|nr:hypothetical protein [Actinomycetota bacterium]
MSLLLLERPPAPPSPAPVTYTPRIEHVRGNVAGKLRQPLGTILHGTRSGKAWSTDQEYASTVSYVRNGAGGLGWHVCVGNDVVCIHMEPEEWGHNARACSDDYLACEFAQARLGDPITDAQVRAFVWWWLRCTRAFPHLPEYFPTHSDLDASGATGKFDGKSDPFLASDRSGADELRARIRAEIERQRR